MSLSPNIYTESASFSQSYLDLIQKAYENNHLVYITTLTWLFKIDIDNVDLLKLYDCFDVKNVSIDKHTQKNNTQFFNQLTLRFINISTKSVKIFRNGHVHITGLSSYFECIEVSKMLLEWLNEFIPLKHSQIYRMKEKSQRIAMINLSINTYPRDLIKLTDLCRELNNSQCVLRCTYDPENYRGVNAKCKSGVSMFVFHTGNIIMSDSSLHNLKEGYLNLSSHFLHKENSSAFIRKKNIESPFHGYDMKDVMAYIVIPENAYKVKS